VAILGHVVFVVLFDDRVEIVDDLDRFVALVLDPRRRRVLFDFERERRRGEERLFDRFDRMRDGSVGDRFDLGSRFDGDFAFSDDLDLGRLRHLRDQRSATASRSPNRSVMKRWVVVRKLGSERDRKEHGDLLGKSVAGPRAAGQIPYFAAALLTSRT